MTLTKQQEQRLLSNVRKWVRMLDESANSMSKAPQGITALYEKYDFSNLTRTPEQFSEVRTSIFSLPAYAHMVAICLRQIDEYARQLESSSFWSGDVARTGSALRRLAASEEVRNLRDVMEHSAEYIAGEGRKPELVEDPDQDWPSGLVVNGKLTRIKVFGRAYEVKDVILAAIEFAKALQQSTESGLEKTGPPGAPA